MVVVALSFDFLSFSFSFPFLAFAHLVVLDDADVLVDVANGLTREARVAAGKRSYRSSVVLLAKCDVVAPVVEDRCCCIGPRKLLIAVLTFKASSMTGGIIS